MSTPGAAMKTLSPSSRSPRDCRRGPSRTRRRRRGGRRDRRARTCRRCRRRRRARRRCPRHSRWRPGAMRSRSGCEKASRATSAPWPTAHTRPSMTSESEPVPSAPRTVTGRPRRRRSRRRRCPRCCRSPRRRCRPWRCRGRWGRSADRRPRRWRGRAGPARRGRDARRRRRCRGPRRPRSQRVDDAVGLVPVDLAEVPLVVPAVVGRDGLGLVLTVPLDQLDAGDVAQGVALRGRARDDAHAQDRDAVHERDAGVIEDGQLVVGRDALRRRSR